MTSSPPTCTPLGDRALLATAPDDGAAVAAWLAACDDAPLDGVVDVVAGFESLAAYFDPDAVEHGRVAAWLGERLAAADSQGDGRSALHELPVCYDGEDLGPVAERAGLAPEEVARRHAGAEYRVRVVGFAPGFPYLEGLPPELHTPRRATPRTRVPAGAVGIGGPYTGVYPDASPGGWNVIGRTPARLFDASRNVPSLLKPGDRVRFTAVGPGEVACPEPAAADLKQNNGDAVARVVRAGVQTTLQDLGRPGRRRLGVAASGAMDARALRIANHLVGNPAGAAALEATLVGPVLEFLEPATVALVGAEADGAPMGRPLPIQSGDRLDLTRLARGARCYAAVAGGWAGDEVLGAVATDVRAQLGGYRGRPLRDGDTLALAQPHAVDAVVDPHWAIAPELVARVAADGPTTLRVLPGPQRGCFRGDAWGRFIGSGFRVSHDSSRVGVRLAGAELARAVEDELPPQPVTRGAVQVPPDGSPIVLGADCQTLGGYPVIACVASVDLPLLAQLSPGDEVRFEEVDLPTALRLAREGESQLRIAMEGIRLHA